MKTSSSNSDFPVLIQNFFCERLMNQQNVSPKTIAAYRDTFRLLIGYLETSMKRSASAITLADLDAPNILGFLDHLETERQNSIRTRNARLAAIRAFLKYAAIHSPTSLPTIQRVLAIPTKRFQPPCLTFLSRAEMEAILAAPGSSRWSGQRDRVMLATMYNTGARVSEIISLRIADVTLTPSASVRIQGKGRKLRVVPLWRKTAKQIGEWLKHISQDPETPLFPNTVGRPLTRSGVENRLREAVRSAARQCPTLNNRRISPHIIRHTTAMHLLQSGVDLTVIALWLGHENPATTHIYMEADIAMKRKALSKIQEPRHAPLRFQPTDKLLQFLESL